MYVRLLGGFEISVGTRTIGENDWRLRKASSLVKLLALSPDHQLHREQVMDLLWPDADPKAAANNLHQALYVARRVLEPAGTTSRYLHFREEWILLCPWDPLQVDVEAFEAAAATARRTRVPASYQVALERYAGGLSPSDRYEGWTEDRREELRRNYLSLLVELAGLHRERGEPMLTFEVLRRAVSSEPAHEAAHAALMRLYAETGQRYQALRQYEQLRETLRRDLDIEPEESSQRLHEEILSGHILTTGPPPAAPPDPARHNLPIPLTSFVGREKELLEIERTLSTTRLLTLTGTGGSGKTRLAVEVARNLFRTYQAGARLIELAPLAEGRLAGGLP